MYCGTLVIASTVVVGVASTQIRLAVRRKDSVVVINPVGLVAVPTATSPTEPPEGEGLTEADGESEAEGESDALGD